MSVKVNVARVIRRTFSPALASASDLLVTYWTAGVEGKAEERPDIADRSVYFLVERSR